MADTLASLVVALQVESAQLRSGLDAAAQKLDVFAKKADGLGKIIAGALSFEVAKDAVSALSHFVLKGAETADQMGKLAQASGVSVEQFSRLNYAADLAGVSSEQLGTALGRLSKGMAGALAGGKEQAAVFKALGVSVTDTGGRLRSAQDVMGDVAERFAGLEDGAAKSALAQELFGKSGAELIPLLNAGRDGLAAMGAEADRFGLTVTSKGAAASEQFNDALRRLEMAGQGVAMRAAQDLAPSLAALGDELLNTAGKSNALTAAAETLAGALRVLVSGGAIVAGVFEAVGKSVGALTAAGAEISMGQYKEALETMKLLGGDLANTAKSTADRIGAIWERQSSAVEQHADKTRKSADEIVRSLGKVTAATVEVGLAGGSGGFGGMGKSAGRALGLPETAGGGVALGRGDNDFERVSRKLIADREKEAVELARLARLRAEAEESFLMAVEGARNERIRAGIDTALGMGGNLGGAIAATAEGGLGGGILALLQGSEAFSSVLATLDEIFTMLADGLGGLLEPLLPLLQVSVMLDKALLLLLKPLESIITGAAPLLFEAFKGNALALLYIAEGIGTIYNSIVDALGSVLRDLSSIPFFGDLDDVADSLAGSRIDVDGFGQAIEDISHLTYEQAEAQRELTKATDQATASMLNVPSGWKINLARFNAINPDLGRPVPGGGGASSPAPGGGLSSSGGAASAPTPEVHVHLDGQQLVNALRIEIRKGDARTRGNPAGLAPAYAGV